MRASVVLPTYNEADNVPILVGELAAALPREDLEILVVDDDSPDGTWRRAEELAASGAPVRVLRRTGERGLVRALNDGIARAAAPVVCWMDADLSMPAALVPELVAAVEGGAEIAVGSRYVEGGSDGREDVLLHRVLSQALNAVARRALGSGLHDYTSGFVAIRREALAALAPLRGEHGEYFIDLVHRARLRGLRVRELPYRCAPRRSGESKTATSVWGFARRGVKYLRTILSLRARPS